MPSRPHLAYPVRLSPGGSLLANEQDSDAEVGDCIAVVLSWPRGTRRGDVSFGVPDQLFGSGGPDLAEIRDAVVQDEPRAEGVSDELLSATLGAGKATITVAFDQRAGEGEQMPGDDLYVVIPSYGPQRSLVVGWAYTLPLPQPGDQCLVTYDENGNPWVVAWR